MATTRSQDDNKADDIEDIAAVFRSPWGGVILEEIIEEVLVALRRVIRATDIHSRQLVKSSGLTAPQLLIMQTIRERDAVTVGDLARAVSLSQATVTTIIDRLERRELVYRERSSRDKRRVYVYLTDHGYERLRDAPRPLQAHFIRRFRDLQQWEQTMILSSLQRVAQMMDAEHIDASPVLDVGPIDADHDHSHEPERSD